MKNASDNGNYDMSTKELKPHPHADVLRAIADGHLSDIEFRHLPDDQWVSWSWSLTITFNPITHKHWQWRVKPNTHWINGIECPAPEPIPPPDCTSVFVPDVADMNLFVEYIFDADKEECKKMHSRGLIHLTKEAAIANAKAMLAFKDAP